MLMLNDIKRFGPIHLNVPCVCFLAFCNNFVLDIVGWLDCPAFGQEINFIIPSKVPLGESFNDLVAPGKRYSSRQVIHQQRVLGRKVST